MDYLRYLAARELSSEGASATMTDEAARRLCFVAGLSRECLRRDDSILPSTLLQTRAWKRRKSLLMNPASQDTDDLVAMRMRACAKLVRVHGIVLNSKLTKQLKVFTAKTIHEIRGLTPVIACLAASWTEDELATATTRTLKWLEYMRQWFGSSDKLPEGDACIFTAFHVGTGEYMPWSLWMLS